jgi:hypothetical protein
MLPSLDLLSRGLSRRPRHRSGQDAARFLFVLDGVSSAASLRSECYPCPSRSRTAPAPLLSRGVQLRGILRSACYPCPLRSRTAPASFCTFAALAPRHRSGLDATRFGLFFLAALSKASAASLRSGCYPASSLLSRGFSKRPRHHSGQDVPRCLFFLVGVSSAASLRSGCSPASSLLSRGVMKLPRHHSGQDVPRRLCFLAAACSAASLRSGCSPASSLLSRGFSRRPRHHSGQDAPRCLFFLVGVSSAASLRLVCYPCP